MGTAVVAIATGVLLRDLRRAAIATWMLVVLFFACGHAQNVTRAHSFAGLRMSDGTVLGAWVALSAAAVLAARRLRDPARVTRGFNILAAALVLVNLVP